MTQINFKSKTKKGELNLTNGPVPFEIFQMSLVGQNKFIMVFEDHEKGVIVNFPNPGNQHFFKKGEKLIIEFS